MKERRCRYCFTLCDEKDRRSGPTPQMNSAFYYYCFSFFFFFLLLPSPPFLLLRFYAARRQRRGKMRALPEPAQKPMSPRSPRQRPSRRDAGQAAARCAIQQMFLRAGSKMPRPPPGSRCSAVRQCAAFFPSFFLFFPFLLPFSSPSSSSSFPPSSFLFHA